ncbi:cytochrome d ubiquinol oxidase subunit II [Methylocystis sp. L43]|uniref:cytochrome d ubiquinol oxidase subunit II n=1 Tax=unclassified Methylocystis TaxID=2625913 RepID=UPI0018C310D8|nr:MULTISPECIES: cytochrome d ubiquinol oxidase subunit II [unclassified Methylocystis]MBG0799392.1 cytochrome d ubiquinol oxidase subunit II [Methylocystis sp. L43]MBG0807174.1 cytochrome d ubiquinol oxidase subunit II [Methylocystis sp. H15]
MFDYMTLRFIWWAILGVLLVGFAVLDGFDIGVAMLHPFVARNDGQRRVSLNTIGPVWEGNQVWFILGGGAAFAAWPPLYAVSFSGFYLAMLLVLIGLILRPVAITFRDKRSESGWRETWDWVFFVSGFVPALIFGVAFGNLLQGVPFHFDQALRATYEGGLLGLLNPFALLCGLVSVAMLTMQGAAWLGVKSDGEVSVRARRYGALAAILLVLLISAAGLWTMLGVEGFRIVGVIDHAGPSNPLAKTVTREAGAWLDNYRAYPWMIAAPALAYAGALVAALAFAFSAARIAFLASSLSVAGVATMAGFSMFPFLLPSSTHPSQSLTVWDASSSKATLSLMLIAVIVFLPIVLAYTSWVYYVLRGAVTEAAIRRGDDYYY